MSETKLPIWRTALLAVHFFFTYAQPLALYLAQYLLITILVALVLLPTVAGDFPTSGLLLEYAIGTYVWCPIAVAVHRRILSDGPLRPASYIYSFGSARTLRFFAYSVLFAGIAALVVGITWIVLGIDSLLGALTTFLVMLVVVACLFRLALVFPGIALDEHKLVNTAWRRLRGSTWRLFWTSMIVVLPLIIVDAIAAQFMSGWSADVFTDVISALIGLPTIAVVSYTYSFVNRC